MGGGSRGQGKKLGTDSQIAAGQDLLPGSSGPYPAVINLSLAKKCSSTGSRGSTTDTKGHQCPVLFNFLVFLTILADSCASPLAVPLTPTATPPQRTPLTEIPIVSSPFDDDTVLVDGPVVAVCLSDKRKPEG